MPLTCGIMINRWTAGSLVCENIAKGFFKKLTQTYVYDTMSQLCDQYVLYILNYFVPLAHLLQRNIKKTKLSPKVVLDKTNNIFFISGRSIYSNANEFYDPIISWFKNYLENPNKNSPPPPPTITSPCNPLLK